MHMDRYLSFAMSCIHQRLYLSISRLNISHLILLLYLVQLGLEQANTKLFITNQINKVIPHQAIDAFIKMEEKVIKIEGELPSAVARFEESIFNELDAGRKEFESYIHQIGAGGPIAEHLHLPNFAMPPTTSPTTEPIALYHDMDCPHGELLQFWKPATLRDMRYKTPYAVEGMDKYVTFEPGRQSSSSFSITLYSWIRFFFYLPIFSNYLHARLSYVFSIR